MGSWRILIVEDEADNAEIISRILAHHSIDHVIVSSAELALKTLETQQFDAFLIDLALPGISGWALLETLHQNPTYAHTVAIAITSYHSTRAAHDAATRGFTAYFPKPVDPATFPRDLADIIQAQQVG